MRGAFDNLSKIREATGILCLDELERIEERIETYAKEHFLNFAEAFNILMKQVWEEDIMEAFDAFCKKHDGIMEIDDDLYDNTTKWKLFAPQIESPAKKGEDKKTIRVATTTRFGAFAPSRNIEFPISSDMQFWINVKGLDSEGNIKEYYSRSIAMSYNELMGYVKGGHKLHWSHKDAFHSEAPNNQAQAAIYYSNWLSDPLYRITPVGQPKVDELLQTGSIVETGSRFGEIKRYVVGEVIKREYAPIEREGKTFEYYNLNLFEETEEGKYKETLYSCGDLVAVDGKLEKLFVTDNTDEYVKEIGIDGNFVEWIKRGGSRRKSAGLFDELEDECSVSCCRSNSFKKTGEMTHAPSSDNIAKQTSIFDFI